VNEEETMIKNLTPRLAEIGRIKIGGVGEERTSQAGGKYRAPVKYDCFVITGMNRGKDGNFERDQAVHAQVGEKPTELEIVLLYNEEPGKESLNFRTQYAFYQGKKCLCRGDGEKGIEVVDFNTGEYKEVGCPCNRLELDKNPCKPHGVLNCLLRSAEIAGGVWKFSTTSWNSISNIIGSLKFLTACTGGKLAGIPLTMKYFKKATFTPKGDPTTIGVVGLFFKGSPVQMLEAAIKTERMRLEAGIRMDTLAIEVRKDFERGKADEEPLDRDEIEEFHPDQAGQADPEKPRETLADALAKKAQARKADPVAEAETVPAVPVTQADPAPVAQEKPIDKAPEKTQENPAEKPLRHFACAVCAATITDHNLPEKCPKCPGSAFKEFKTLKEAQAYAPPKSTTASAPANPPASARSEDGEKKAIVDEILKLRAAHNIGGGAFVIYVKKATNKTEVNADKWTLEETVAVRDVIRQIKTQNQGQGAQA
jgi:rubrerythrin